MRALPAKRRRRLRLQLFVDDCLNHALQQTGRTLSVSTCTSHRMLPQHARMLGVCSLQTQSGHLEIMVCP